MARLSLIAAGAALALAAPAEASVTVLVDGTIASGYDTTGEFGAPETDLSGLTYHAEFVFHDEDPSANNFDGGPNHSYTFAPAIATITIGGSSLTFEDYYDAYPSSNYAQLYVGDDNGNPTVYGSDAVEVNAANYYSNYRNTFLGFQFTNSAASANLISDYHYNQNLDITLTASENFSGYPGSYSFLYIYDYTPGAPDFNHLAYATSEVAGTRIRILGNSMPGAVPEPATWALLILGFGLIGGALRGRARAAGEARARIYSYASNGGQI